MSESFSKIEQHPDREFIIEKLRQGVSVRNIESFLKTKYQLAKRHISYLTLQKYRSRVLKLDKAAIKAALSQYGEQSLIPPADDELKLYGQLYKSSKTKYIKCVKCGHHQEHSSTVGSFLIRFSEAHKKAIQRGLEWCIQEEEYLDLITQPCYYCGKKLASQGVGLDRRDNNVGYLVSNVVPCCGPCNLLRRDLLTTEEMKVVATALNAYRSSK